MKAVFGLVGLLAALALVMFIARQGTQGTAARSDGSSAAQVLPGTSAASTVAQAQADIERAVQQSADRASELDR